MEKMTTAELLALQAFDKWFAENYPGPRTIISDPHWHSPKIFRAALSAYQDALDELLNKDGGGA